MNGYRGVDDARRPVPVADHVVTALLDPEESLDDVGRPQGGAAGGKVIGQPAGVRRGDPGVEAAVAREIGHVLDDPGTVVPLSHGHLTGAAGRA